MLIRLEIKRDCRVTGLSFHSERTWVLAGLYNGVIELWDYCTGALIDSFQGDRRGAVRAVHFHSSEPFFVSGGDDCEIKMWSYMVDKGFVSLLGHQDHIRTVQFHHIEPWILSAGDDNTVRIWNWNSSTCISVLRSHSHPVTCASFHPEQYLVVSASMDQTVRVWNIISLKNKQQSFLNWHFDIQSHCFHDHDQVNWASFHPTLPLIFSCGNDHQVKIWEIDDEYPRQVGTLKGHMHSVSCVLFHARQNVIVSNSQDKTIRMWDPTKKTCLGTFCREETFSILASHPSNNVIGAGHDKGILVFKLARERPAFYVSQDSLLYVKNQALHAFNYLTQDDVKLTGLCPLDSDCLNKGWQTIYYSPTQNAVIICSGVELDSYELYALNEPSRQGKSSGLAVFVAQDRLAVLKKSSKEVFVKNLDNRIVKKIILPIVTDTIFYAGHGNLLCGAEDRVIMFDLHQQIVLGNIQASFIRYVVWSSDMESVALLSKYSIVIADKKLVRQCNVLEKDCVKSGTWNDNGVFVYTTQRHIKYCLPNGETGIIKTLGVHKYITKMYGSTIFCLDRDRKICPVIVDSTEYMFKLFLMRKRYDQVMNIIRNSKLHAQAMITYLKQKGSSEVALHFVKDERIRFTLALESGNFHIAVSSAEAIDDNAYWKRLAAEALFHGKTGIAEYVYERTKNLERLSFLYFITGNLDKLLKLMKTSEVKNDVVTHFHHVLYMGDIEERVKILENAGHLPLAYVTASVHGLGDVAKRLSVALADNVPSLPKETSGSLLIPPKPLLLGGDWSSLVVNQGVFERDPENFGKGSNVENRDATDANFGEASVIGEVDRAITVPNTRTCVFIAPAPGMPFNQNRVENSIHAAEHAAVGNFETALWILSQQYRMKKFSHFRSPFIDLFLGSQTFMCGFPSAPVISITMNRHWNLLDDDCGYPMIPFNCSGLEKKFEIARELFTKEWFSIASILLLYVLHVLPLTVLESQEELAYTKHLRRNARNYILVAKIQLKRQMLQNNLVRQLQLAVYSTHITLYAADYRKILCNAMTDCHKAGNWKTAAVLAIRLLEAVSTNNDQRNRNGNMRDERQLNHNFAKPSKTAVTIDKYSIAADQVLRDSKGNKKDLLQINYDYAKTFKICGATLNPIFGGQSALVCCYCKANSVPSREGQLCTVCDVAEMVVAKVAFDITYIYPPKLKKGQREHDVKNIAW